MISGTNFKNTLHQLLAQNGIKPVETQKNIETTVMKTFEEAGLEVEMLSIRYGSLVVKTDAATSHLIGWDKEKLLKQINIHLDETDKIRRLSVHVH